MPIKTWLHNNEKYFQPAASCSTEFTTPSQFCIGQIQSRESSKQMSYRSILRLIRLPVSALLSEMKNTMRPWQCLPRHYHVTVPLIRHLVGWQLLSLMLHMLDLCHSIKGQMSRLCVPTSDSPVCKGGCQVREEDTDSNTGLLCGILNFLT